MAGMAPKTELKPSSKPKKAGDCCEHCGALMKEYTHLMNRGLVGCLKALANAVREQDKNDVLFSDIAFESFNARNNFQKLNYWGLAVHVRDANGARVKGHWLLTSRGGQFLRGELAVPKHVRTYRNVLFERSEELVTIRDVERNQDMDYYQKEYSFQTPLADVPLEPVTPRSSL